MSYTATLERLKSEGNFRTIPDGSTPGVIDLSSNDYLGLASDSSLVQRFFESTKSGDFPAMTSSASRLLAQNQEEYHRLEQKLSRLYGSRSVLLFNSGYHANTGLISALASEPRTLIVADKLVHASMIDGMILSRAPFRRFAHNDLEHLERIITKEIDNYDRIIVCVESVYSMDGDSPDIDTLISIKQRFQGKVMLYIDEAHAFGVCGPKGLGLCAASPMMDEVDIIVGTFGKAAASCGAFAVMSAGMHDYAVNRSRSLIFSTALPPINIAWTHFILDRMTGMDAERRHLHELSEQIAGGISPTTEASHIIPVIVGDARLTVDLSRRLLDEGFKVLPIRTPTVPPGTERLRISLSASLTMPDADRFISCMNHCLSHT